MNTRRDNSRVIRAATGTTLSAKSWLTEAPLRMLMNNLDPGVAERPEELVVYGGGADDTGIVAAGVHNRLLFSEGSPGAGLVAAVERIAAGGVGEIGDGGDVALAP